jgi:hypothetical protein
MIPGIGGPLLSIDACERLVPEALSGRLGEGGRAAARRRLRAWHRRVRDAVGPATTARGLFDLIAAPLAAQLGYAVRIDASGALGGRHRAGLEAGGRRVAALTVPGWRVSPWRDGVLAGLAQEVSWCFCVTGPELHLVDVRRTFARRYLRIDLTVAFEDERAFALLWGLLRAEAMDGPGPPLVEVAVQLSESHRREVRASLQDGVQRALASFGTALLRATGTRRRGPGHEARCRAESLVLVYRVLFLLFAEARGLVPSWHAVYRESYTIESLRSQVELLPRPRGLWDALQAIARLAHHGCHAGTLTVEPFNGPLFSPAQAPLADTLHLDDGLVRSGVLALTTRKGRVGRERIAYGDLGVEQLGGVYERLLDDESVAGGAGKRRETGAFYTPRGLTEYIVRRTLAPLVEGRGPDEILALRVLDPAMGSGAFLVAACRYLAAAYERAVVAAGVPADEVGDAERAGFRRLVAQRCLYGVDLNPMAVHLGRLSLWLATLAAGRPLTFLDHHLRSGDSLVGAGPEDVQRQPRPGRAERRGDAELPLFADAQLDVDLGVACGVREAVAVEPGETVAQVRAKERALARLGADAAAIGRWREVADLWCAAWFVEPGERRAFPQVFPSLADRVLTGGSALPERVAKRWEDAARAEAGARRFFHWRLEFPEVFYDGSGRARVDGGFDAVLGNPPWEVLRNDGPGGDGGAARAGLAAFARGSGAYRWQGDGHPNLYQLFLERALTLLRPTGRFGLILPSGLAVDHGCARLRRAVLDTCRFDTFTVFDNRSGVFPIHRSLRFLLAAGTRAPGGRSVPVRAGVADVETLERLPDQDVDPLAVPLTRAFISGFSGEQQVIPDVRSALDRDLVAAVMARAPALGDAAGWRVRFGRELNATEDRRLFTTGNGGLAVIEGKHLQPFHVDTRGAAWRVTRKAIAGRLIGVDRPRLAYRDVASAGNRLTLIAAVVPAGVVTTHTVFVMKGDAPEDLSWFLCGVFNSFVANYLVRLRVTTHVTVTIVEQLPVPIVDRQSPEYRFIASSARRLAREPGDERTGAALQAAVARLYGLQSPQFERVLETFPLVSRATVEAVRAAFTV